jgi:hypothetical protein
MQVVRLPTIRSKHLETVVHTFLSTLHVLVQPCDVVHYHALGPALFSFIPRLRERRLWSRCRASTGSARNGGASRRLFYGWGERAAVSYPRARWWFPQDVAKHYLDSYGAETSYVPNGGVLRERRLPDKIFDWGWSRGNTFCFWGDFLQKRLPPAG